MSEFWEGILILMLVWWVHKIVKSNVEHYSEKTTQTIINVGIALGLSNEDALKILQKNKEKDEED